MVARRAGGTSGVLRFRTLSVSGHGSGNFRNDRLRRVARMSRPRERPANDEIIRSGGNRGSGRHGSFLAGGFGARWPDSRGHKDHIPVKLPLRRAHHFGEKGIYRHDKECD